MISNTRKALTV